MKKLINAGCRLIGRFLPMSSRMSLLSKQQARDLLKTERIPCESSSLALVRDFEPNQIFHSSDLDREWAEEEARIAPLAVTTSAGGVNAGDRRAIYYLTRHLRPQSVLEVG